MRVSIPFQYKAHYVLRRMRTANTVTLSSEAMLDIREAPVSAARVAFLVADASGMCVEFSQIEGKPRRIIELDGCYWRDLGDEERFRRIVETRTEKASENLLHDHPFAPDTLSKELARENQTWGTPPHNGMHWDPAQGGTTRNEVEQTNNVREWTDDGGFASINAMRANVSMLVAVGGHVFQRCEEPCWCVRTSANEVTVGLTVTGPDRERRLRAALSREGYSNKPRIGFDHLFNLSREEDAVLLARELAAELGIPRVRVTARAKIAPSGNPTFADDLLSVERAAWLANKDCDSDLIAVSRSGGLAWFALRDALEESEGHVDAAVVRAVSGMAERWPVRNTVAREHSSRDEYGSEASIAFSRSGSGGAKVAAAAAACRVAARRWERRPRGNGEWLGLVQGPAFVSLAGVTVHEAVSTDELKRTSAVLDCDLVRFASDASEGRGKVLIAVADGECIGAAFTDAGGAVEVTFGKDGERIQQRASEAFDNYLEKEIPAPVP